MTTVLESEDIQFDPSLRASGHEELLARRANEALLKLVAAIANDDPWFSIARFALLALISLATLGATIALIIGASKDATWAALASAGALIGTLGIVGLMNPLQTVERDVVIRRWSDVVLAGWATSVATEPKAKSATRVATEQFAVLAAAYSAMTGKTLDALGKSIEKIQDGTNSAANELTVDPVADQATVQGKAANPVTVKATGGSGKYEFAMSGAPSGLSIDKSTGRVTGTVAAAAPAQDSVVAVTVTEVLDAGSAASPKSKTIKFVWAVKAP